MLGERGSVTAARTVSEVAASRANGDLHGAAGRLTRLDDCTGDGTDLHIRSNRAFAGGDDAARERSIRKSYLDQIV